MPIDDTNAPSHGVAADRVTAPSPADQDTATAAEQAAEPRARKRFILGVLVAVALPLAVYYGLRLLGVNQWLSLLLGGLAPLIHLGFVALRQRRLEMASIFTLTLLVIGTAIGLITGDPRLLLARESYLTAVAGIWILITLLTARPFLFTATLPLLPVQTAQQWQSDWQTVPPFRRAIRAMTAGWGLAFVLDAIARVIMAYTLPLDWVPGLSIALLIIMLIVVVQGTKAWAQRRHNSKPEHRPREQQ